MKQLVFALIFAGGLAHASVTCNSVTGTLEAVVVQADYTGCLTANTTQPTLIAGTANPASGPAGFVVDPSATGGYYAGNLEVEYSVAYSAGLYTYTYNIDNTSNMISHWILGLDGDASTCKTISAGSGSCISSILGTEYNNGGGTGVENAGTLMAGGGVNVPTDSIPSPGGDTGFQTSPAGGANIDMPWNLYSLQIQPKVSGERSFVVSFTSAYAPVWQDIYVRDSNTQAWNTGGNVGGTLGNLFVAAPGHIIAPPVPEPGFYGLVTIGMIGLFLVRRSSRKNPSTT
jgi:hypothetical protein